jgi:hypothetical protein
VPATIITSDCRSARGKAEALGVIARHRHLHHLDGAAGEPERHPHQRAGARPDDEIIRRGNEESLVGELVIEPDEVAVVGADRLAGARIEDAGGGRGDEGGMLRR